METSRSSMLPASLCRVLTLPLLFAGTTLAAATTDALEKQFQENVKPYLRKHCIGCHSGKTPAAQFDLTTYRTLAEVTREYPRWDLVKERLEAKDMPPKPVPAPPAADSKAVTDWVHAVRTEEIRKYAGDPGIVPARRLSNAEYNYTIRDLIGGHDLRITREFPIDPANPAGFDNSGESLTMSPALLNKYLQAAREVASHMVLSPDSVDFAPHPMLVETDREKYAIQRIIDFYYRQPTKFASYFEAAWKYQHRAALGKPVSTSLATVAAESKVSPKYLEMVWTILQEPGAIGPVLKLQQMFRALPAPGSVPAATLAGKCAELDAYVTRIRALTAMQFAAPKVRGLPAGSQPLLNWKNRMFAENRRKSDPKALRNDTDPPPGHVIIPRRPGLHQETFPYWAAVVARARNASEELVVPAAQRKEYEAAFARFASVFPDAFYISERGRYFPEDSEDKGRFLSAGFHNTNGFFRDDIALQELLLDDKGRAELERLWLEFDYIAAYTGRTFVQYYFNQSGEVMGKGAESGSPRPVGHEVTDSEVIVEMRDKYLAKAAADPNNDPLAPKAIREHFDGINATLRNLEKLKQEAAPKHLQSLVRFAARAYRRPLTRTEADDIPAYYKSLRDKRELSHEDAIRETVVSILMSPDFLYRFDLSQESNGKTAPLSNYALASRLSYFLWASMPDEELLRAADSGDLQRPEVLLAQMRRMLKDPRVRGFATEFAGNWLGFRQFETNNSVDRERFPEFNNDLREAMFQEPIRVLTDTVSKNQSILDLLFGKHTFVNQPLAKHYGMPYEAPSEKGETWVRINDAAKYGRGGLLPMAVFLTQNSPGLRTSPVKRGNWVVQRVLGEVVPPPPPVVPELPHDESSTDLPVRELLAKHRENALCSACHQRIDSFGLGFEGYGPVGNVRAKDLAGRNIDNTATYPGGFQGTGVAGLQQFIRDKRQKDFVTNVSRKLLAYALNRSLQLSDEALVDTMQTRAAGAGHRFDVLFETIVSSPQFRNKRGNSAQ